ncbi:MAG: exo-alpha-sialidase [Planctomycetales bacterium]|nr:exo-alpha-sialidase [Planctomycetales bacterium]
MNRFDLVSVLLALALASATEQRAKAEAPWQSSYWTVTSPSSGQTIQRAAPIRNLIRTDDGLLLGTRSNGSAIELWQSDNNGVDWRRMNDVAQSAVVNYGDPTLYRLANGALIAGYRERHPTLGWSVRVSRSLDNGVTWSFAGTVHDWTGTTTEFVGAPQFLELSDGTLQVYYDSEPAASGGSQYIALKTGAFDGSSQLYNWSHLRTVNHAGVGGTLVRDGLATVVNLGSDPAGQSDRIMVVTEGVSSVGGVPFNIIRAFQAGGGGADQNDWDNPLDARIVYQSRRADGDGLRYNAYAPYAIRINDGPVLVAFSTDEFLEDFGVSPDASSDPVATRHSEIKWVQTTSDFEHWSTPQTLWGLDHPDFDGSFDSGDIFNYQIGLIELAPNDLLATLDLFGGRQLVLRPILGERAADFDQNGLIDGLDLLRWQQGRGLVGQTSTATGDATGEGIVDLRDYLIWANDFGLAATPSTAVPEPLTWQLVVASAATGLGRRRRRCDVAG